MSDDKKPITAEMMKAYITILEKQVSQMTLVVNTLEELNDKLEAVENHFHNGFKSDIVEHITNQIENIEERMNGSIVDIAIIKQNVEKSTNLDRVINKTASEITDTINDKIGELKGNMMELQSSIKVDKAISIIGWSGFLLSMVTIILKLFGKL